MGKGDRLDLTVLRYERIVQHGPGPAGAGGGLQSCLRFAGSTPARVSKVVGMIKARGQLADRPLLLFGLSGENVTRIVAGEPVEFDLADMGMSKCRIVIMYGRTEADILKEVRAASGGKMRIHGAALFPPGRVAGGGL